MTGLITGIEDFIRANAPVALDMPPATYDEFFKGPWAKDRVHEKKHRELTKCIGESLRGKFLEYTLKSIGAGKCFKFFVIYTHFTIQSSTTTATCSCTGSLCTASVRR